MKTICLLILSSILLCSCSTLNIGTRKLTFSKKIAYKDVNLSQNKLLSNDSLERYSDYPNEIYASNSGQNEITPYKTEKLLIHQNNQETGCDKILLKTGEEIEAKVLEIGVQEIKYKNCSNLQGPTISLLKSDAFMITYANGSKEVFKEAAPRITANSNNINGYINENIQKKTNGFAITSLILGIIGIPVLGLIFGLIARAEIRDNPNTQKGDGMAVAGIVLSVISLFILFIIILSF
jgi:hypothetical protein